MRMLKRRSRMILTWTLITLGVVFVVYKCQHSIQSVKDGMSEVSRDQMTRLKEIRVEDAMTRVRSKSDGKESKNSVRSSSEIQGVKCSHFTCMDVSRCEVISRNHISVYIYPVSSSIYSTTGMYPVTDSIYSTTGMYPVTNSIYSIPDIPLTHHPTDTFTGILKGISTSSFITSDPKDACLFIPSIDASLFFPSTDASLFPSIDASLIPSTVLESLPFWSVSGLTSRSTKKGFGGQNHLLFDVGNSKSDLSRNSKSDLSSVSNRAMVASSRFDSWTFRPGFDVSIPLYHSVQNSYRANRTLERKWFLNILSIDSFSPEERRVLGEVGEENPDSVRITEWSPNEGEYLDLIVRSMEESTFCLLPSSNDLLSLVMMTNCIPIQIISDDSILPFEEKIRWHSALISIRRDRVKSVISILKEMTKSEVASCKNYGKYLYSKYLKSPSTIALTTLEIVNDRMIPFSIKDNSDEIDRLTCSRFDSIKDKGLYGKKNSLKMRRINRKDIFS